MSKLAPLIGAGEMDAGDMVESGNVKVGGGGHGERSSPGISDESGV